MSTITAAEATLRRARELESLGASGKGDALDDLLKFLEGLRHFQWQGDKNIDTVFEECVRLAIETNRIKELRNPVSTMRRRARDHGTMEGYAKFTLEQGRKMVEAAITAAKEDETKVSAEELILRKMLGVSAAQRGLECHVGPAFQRYEDLVTTWLYALERERSEAVYQRIAVEGLRLCASHGRTDQITQINKLVQRHLNEVFEGETDDRKRQIDAIVSAPHAIEAIVNTKQEQVRVAGELRDWAAVTAAMRDMRRVVQKLAVHHADVNLDNFLELESEVLFAAHSHLLHADNIAKVAERRAARGEDAEMLASQAVIAALCVPDTSLSTDEAQDRIARLCRQVQIAVVPTRDSLLAALEKPIAGKSLLDRASPSVRALHALLAAAPTIEVCAKAAPLLAELEQHEKLARYVQVLQTVFVRAMLGIMSRCFSSLSIAEFVERCGGFLRPGTEDFAARVEPLLLQEMFGRRVHVMVDFGAEMINFIPAAVNNRNLTAFMGELCADVAAAVRPCYIATAAPSPSAPAKAAKDLEELVEQARDRTMARYMVGTKRLNNADVRLKAILEKEKQVKEEKRKEQWEREQARNKAARAKQDDVIQQEIKKEETLERRRLVVRNLQNKYRGFIVPAELVALLDETAFSNRVSTALASFLETRDSVRSSDLKAMEYWERACREVEKPLREAHTKQVAADNAREYALRAENRAKQHRKDWEDAKKLKERLGRLLVQKDAYEKQIRGSYEAQRAKTVGKRAEQQEALERAKAEREAAAGGN